MTELPSTLNHSTAAGLAAGYIAGGLIALLILGYLFYSLVKPEKF
jgi:K+-transporting ATPase KdpF subunit